ncbi:ALB3B [Auxenochlorella protothecoides x Auxenochlorella symbiontica]
MPFVAGRCRFRPCRIPACNGASKDRQASGVAIKGTAVVRKFALPSLTPSKKSLSSPSQDQTREDPLAGLAAHLTTALFVFGTVAGPALADQLPQAAAAAGDAAQQVAEAPGAAAAAAKNTGFFGFFSGGFEAFLKMLDGNLSAAHVPYSYGFSIILLTLLVKVVTWPLAKKQAESTFGIQAIQPRLKELQAQLKDKPAELQAQTAALYQSAGVNPLAGCLPALVTIPIFIGLYRALSNVADEGLLGEGFFWIPSLAGPTTNQGGLGWLKLAGGAPPLGWHDTIAYLVLPVLLVVSQYISQKVLQPPSADPSQAAQSNAILKFLPLMIGWFSLNVPSGLGLYWLTNNLVTTGQQLYFRRQFAGASAGSGSEIQSGTSSSQPSSSQVYDVEATEVKPSGKELNARRSSNASSSSRGKKFKALREREAAQRTQGGASAAEAPERSKSGVATISAERGEAERLKVPDAPPAQNNNRD